MNFKKLAHYALFGLVVLFSGCASVNRQAVQVFPPAQTDKGVVYFFREHKLVGCAISYNIKEGDKVLGPAGNGTYFFVIAEPGSHTYTASTESATSRTINVEAGKIYYVECGVEMGVFAGRPSMRIVAEEEGKSLLPHLTYATK